MTFPIKESINTELWVDKKQGLYIPKWEKERIKKITDFLEEGKTEMAGTKTRQSGWNNSHYMEGKTN